MFQELELTFQRGSILTAEMLHEIYSAPREMQDILYNEYPDGILSGTGLTERDGSIYMRKGLVKYEGRIYRMTEDLDLTDCVSSQLPKDSREELHCSLVFCPEEPVDVDGRSTQRRHSLCVKVLSQSEKEHAQGIPFASFRYAKRGGALQLDISAPEDRKSPANAIFWNMVQCPYSCRGGTTFHPHIFSLLRETLSERLAKQPWGFSVMAQLDSTGVLSMEMIRFILHAQHAKPVLDGLSPQEQRVKILQALANIPAKEEIALAEAANKPKRTPSGSGFGGII